MKYLLISILLISTAFLAGRTYELAKKDVKSTKCLKKILNQNHDVHSFYGHRVHPSTYYPHTEAMISNKYLFCILGREDG